MQTELNEPTDINAGEGVKLAVWAIDQSLLMSKQPAINGECTIVYDMHWGEDEVSETVTDPTYTDLYLIASRLIHRSGDTHHVFIENFYHDHANVWKLSTGS